MFIRVFLDVVTKLTASSDFLDKRDFLIGCAPDKVCRRKEHFIKGRKGRGSLRKEGNA
jgi:hypothetical protein